MMSSWDQSAGGGSAQAPAIDHAGTSSEGAPAQENGSPKIAARAPAAIAEDPGAGNIDKIRDILFGSNMRDYEARFARLERVLQQESADVRETTRRSIENLESYVKQELEALHVRFKTERDERAASMSQISREIKEMGNNIAKRVAEVDDHATATHHELREQLLQHGRDTAEHIQSKHREAAALLEQRYQELRKDKTDRSALAALFSEVALRLNNEFNLPGVDH